MEILLGLALLLALSLFGASWAVTIALGRIEAELWSLRLVAERVTSPAPTAAPATTEPRQR